MLIRLFWTAVICWALPTVASAEERCAAIVGPAKDQRHEWLSEYSVSAAPRPLVRPDVSDELRAITCVRESLYLLPSDTDVLTDIGVPFVVGTFQDDGRVVMLRGERADMVITTFFGQLTAEERVGLERVAAEMRVRLEEVDP